MEISSPKSQVRILAKERPMLACRQKLLLLLLFFSGLVFPVTAQEITSQLSIEVDKLQSGIEGFFTGLNNPMIGPEQAFNTLVGKGPLKSKTELAGLIDKAGKLEGRYGRYTGHDVASVKTVGSDLVILRYLYKGERFPVVWHFYYYRPGNGTLPTTKGEWNLIEIRFDTNLEGLDK
jgi:hypothetical protein